MSEHELRFELKRLREKVAALEAGCRMTDLLRMLPLPKDIEAQLASVTAERDGLQARLTTMGFERASFRDEAQRLKSERDRMREALRSVRINLWTAGQFADGWVTEHNAKIDAALSKPTEADHG